MRQQVSAVRRINYMSRVELFYYRIGLRRHVVFSENVQDLLAGFAGSTHVTTRNVELPEVGITDITAVRAATPEDDSPLYRLRVVVHTYCAALAFFLL